jgi:endonuclease/exonuclease/phosphatase family metal-dependent hydrolase
MKIISWNAWVHNSDQIGNLQKLIHTENPYLICLQEANVDCLNYVQNQTKYHYISAIDHYSFRHKPKDEFYLIILSKSPILNKSQEYKFSVGHLTGFSIWEKLNRWHESVEFCYVDVLVNGQKCRFFNVHLELACGPLTRLRQLEECFQYFHPSLDNFICGDLNIYAHPLLNLWIGWLMGFKPHEYFINERHMMEQIFAQNGLQNPHRRLITYPKYRLQLDHILSPVKRPVVARVLKSKFGSDHQPIEIVLQ